MGMRTEMQMEAWQKAFGLQPATGEAFDAWCRLQDVCVEAIKIAELEKSGIRDGDGYWHGSDVVGATLSDLHDAISRLRKDVCKHFTESDANPVPPVPPWAKGENGHDDCSQVNKNKLYQAVFTPGMGSLVEVAEASSRSEIRSENGSGGPDPAAPILDKAGLALAFLLNRKPSGVV